MRTIIPSGSNIKLVSLAFALILCLCFNGLMAQDSYEPNNNFGQAATLPLSGSINCSIHQQADLDYFKFKMDQGGVISLNVPVNSTGIRVRLRVYLENSNTLVSDEIANTAGGTVTLEAVIPSGNYYLLVNDYNGGSSALNFSLGITLDLTDQCEWNQTIGEACLIPFNTSFQAKIRGEYFPAEYNNDIEYYKTTVPQGGVLSVNIPIHASGLRLRIRIFHENTTDLISDEIAPSANGTVTAEAVVPTGTYYIVINDYNGNLSASAFTVNVSFDISDACEWNNNVGNACQIKPNTSFQAKIRGENFIEEYDNDIDYYKIALDRGGVLSVNIPLHTSKLRLRVRIFLEDANSLIADGIASQQNGTITVEAVVPAGNYFIVITDYNGDLSATSFTVNVNFDTSDNGEWNHNFATAAPILNNVSFFAKIRGTYLSAEYDNDIDHYKILFSQAGTLKVNIPVNQTVLQLRVRIFAENTQDLIKEGIASAKGGTVTVETNVLAGAYYIVIYDYNGNLSADPFTVNIGNPSGPPANCILPSVYTLSTTNITPNTATLNSGMSGFSTYEFNYRSVGSSNWAAIETTNSSMLIVNLVASTQYEFRVRVKCADNSWSEWTGNEVFSTSGSGTNTCVLPQVYTLSTSNIAKNSATLNSGLSGFSQYEFNYRKVGGNTWETVSSVNSSITLSSLSSSTPYEFRVRARCTNLEWSTFTGNESFTTLVDEGSSNDKAQLYLSTTRASATDTARITVRANNFKDIGGFQFSVAIPSGKAKIVGIDNAASFPGLLIRQEAPERWGFIWYDPNLAAKTLPDSSVLVTLKVVFNTSVAENECVPIVFDIDPTDIVVSTLINQEVGEYIPSTANGEVCLLSTAKLKGTITNTAGVGVNAVSVSIGGKISTTNDKGEYEMPQLLRGRTYVIKPLKTGNHKNGVNVVDVVTIRQHILGDKPFGDPYRYIVSDVNGSGSVNVADVVIIQQLILGQIDSFSRNWVFVPANYRFSSPAAAIKEKFPEEITLTNLDGDKSEQNFIGLKMGDANNSASPKAKLIDRPGLSIAALTMQAGQKLEIPVYPHELNYIKGFQCELSTQNGGALEILGITLNEQTQLKSNNFDLSDIQSGALRILWLENLQSSLGLPNDKPLFLLQVQAKANLDLAKQLYINSADFENQFVDEELNWVKGTLIFDLTSQEKGVDQQVPSPKIYPNPSSTDPTIEFSLAHSADYTIDVFAGSGSKIKTYSIQGLPGVNQTKLDGMAAFPGGVYQYRINLPGDVLIGKFLIVK